MKKLLVVLASLCISLTFSCKQTGTIRKISRNGSGFMCIGSKQFVSQKGKAEDAAVLNITAGNVIDLVDFTDENGEKIEVEVTGFVYVNEHYFVVRLNVGDFIVSYDSGICYKIDENVPSLGHRASQMDRYGNLYYIPGSESIVKLEFKQDGTLVQTVMPM